MKFGTALLNSRIHYNHFNQHWGRQHALTFCTKLKQTHLLKLGHLNKFNVSSLNIHHLVNTAEPNSNMYLMTVFTLFLFFFSLTDGSTPTSNIFPPRLRALFSWSVNSAYVAWLWGPLLLLGLLLGRTGSLCLCPMGFTNAYTLDPFTQRLRNIDI